jgi:iron complex transport system substrate-binding protein
MRNRTLSALLCFAVAAFAADAPKRIVSLAPNVTEMLYGIGAFPDVVGVTEYCSYPPEVKSLPTVGSWHNPNLEKLLAMRPGLVIADDGQVHFVQDKIRDLGFSVLVVPSRTVADVYTAIGELGRATGRGEGAARLVTTTHDALARVSRRTAGLPKLTVVVIVNRTPGTLRDLYTATDGTFLAELVEIAGGRVVIPANAHGYNRLSKEDLLAINPDVILDFIHGSGSRLAGDPMAAWKEMSELKAVRSRRLYGVQEDYVPHASQRIAETAALFARLIHPEAK